LNGWETEIAWFDMEVSVVVLCDLDQEKKKIVFMFSSAF
jgi:hypothetical protein